LAVYAVAAPLIISAIGASRAGSPPALLGTIALSVALLGPCLAAIIVAARGLAATARRVASRADGEAPLAIGRLAATGAVLAYLAVLSIVGDGDERLPPMLAVAIPAILCAWLTLAHLLLRPDASLGRRSAALVGDSLLVSAFLHFGAASAAPCFTIYLLATLGSGFAFGTPFLIAGGLLGAAGFAAMVAATPFWQAQPFMTAGVAVALLLVPACAFGPIRRRRHALTKFAAADATQNRFLAFIGHELRTPLTSLIGMISLFERTSLDAQQRDMMATLHASSRGLATLVDDLLDFARLGGGGLAPPVAPFMLHEMLNGVVAMLRPDAEAKGLTLSLSIDPRLPHACRGFAMPLRQVMTNLVANAVKFTARGRVSVSATLLARTGDELRVQLAVRDDGIGIPAEAHGRIFDAFAQADETVARRFGGNGLGLAIAREFTELMGGTIRVESAIDTGSMFIVELTLAQDLTAAAQAPDLTGRRLVLISADREFATALQTRLRAWHGEPAWYVDGDLALTSFAAEDRSLPPSLLLLDGRGNPLAALSLAHRIATTMPRQPVMLFIAAQDGGGAIADIAAAQITAIVEAPISDAALAGALLTMIAAEPRGRAADEQLADLAAARPLRILIADDDAANCKILASVLQAAGHDVVVAVDGAAALAMLDREPLDLALIDINMPEVSGCDVTRLYRVDHRDGPRLPIIALTADATRETEHLCLDAGMDSVLAKPIDAGRLLRTVDDVHAQIVAAEKAAEPSSPKMAAPRPIIETPRVTPISSHPRFVADNAAVIDDATVTALRILGGNEFVADVVASFRSDAWRLLDQLRNAVARGDARGFRDTIHSLRSGGANVGALRLCQTLSSLREATVNDLRQTGLSDIDNVETELIRLDASFVQLLREQRRV
jgi:two-component system sensor histidine kinase RpfC